MKGARQQRLLRARTDETLDADRLAVLNALSANPRHLPSRFFYDQRGAELFVAITETQAYYPTRVETAILRRHAPDLAHRIGRSARIIEFGSGNGVKSAILLDALDQPSTYLPIDVAREQLEVLATHLRNRLPELVVHPICADYAGWIELPEPLSSDGRTVLFFPGSTIGNSEPAEAFGFLSRVTGMCGAHGYLIIGVDLKKDTPTLERAYNDPEGITAQFNLNILAHINRRLGTNFDLNGFRHHAFYNQVAGRIEMHLISMREQSVTVPMPAGPQRTFPLHADESIVTEHSYKFSRGEFSQLARRAGYTPIQVMTDAYARFAVFLLQPRDPGPLAHPV